MKGKINPRQYNGRARVRAAQRYAAMDAPCALCGGARGPIRYDQPRNHMFPLSLVIDEIHPVARWQEFGYASAKQCACDPRNWQPAHWICNAEAGDKARKKKRAKIPQARQRDTTSGTF